MRGNMTFWSCDAIGHGVIIMWFWCMYICYMNVYIKVCIKAHLHDSVCICMHIWVHIIICICMYACRQTCIYVCMYIQTHITYMHAHIDVYILVMWYQQYQYWQYLIATASSMAPLHSSGKDNQPEGQHDIFIMFYSYTAMTLYSALTYNYTSRVLYKYMYNKMDFFYDALQNTGK